MQATARGIHVSNIPSEGTGNALSCAEMAMYLALACLRSASAMAESIQHGRVGVPLGKTLYGKSVLIVGFGGIAKELVPRCVSRGEAFALKRLQHSCAEHTALIKFSPTVICLHLIGVRARASTMARLCMRYVYMLHMPFAGQCMAVAKRHTEDCRITKV